MKLVLIFLSTLLGLLPQAVLRAMGTGLGLAWFYVFRFRREEILSNLRLAFGIEKTERELYLLARANCIHYGRTLLDFLVCVAWKKQDYLKIPMEGEEHLVEALRQGRGVYMLCSHLGLWEYSIATVAARGYPLDVVVKRARSEWMEKLIVWYRLKSGARTFPETGITSELFKSLSQNRAIGFVLDQFMGPPIGLPVKFFGKLAGTAVGLALFSEKRDAPVLLLYNYRDGQGQPRTVISPPIPWPDLPQDRNDRLYLKTQAFNDMYEKIIRQYPDQWLWIHRRWKEYRGEPRWKTKVPAWVTCALLMVSTACTSNPTASPALVSPSGQTVPVEPKVDVPKEAPIQEILGKAPETSALSKTSSIATVEKPSAKLKAKIPLLGARPEKKAMLRKFEASDLPFEAGEKQVLDLSWTMLPAGRITLEVKENAEKNFGGRPAFHFYGKIRSSKIVDTIYRVDNTIQSYVDKEWFLPYKFLLTMDEKMQLKETRVVFDHPKHKAFYWSDRKSERWGNEVQDRTDPIETNAVDMYSAIYYARLLEYKLGERQEYRVYENAKNLTVSLLPVANELVQTPVGAFQCWKIQTTVLLNNVLKPAGDMFVWLSDDFKKYIVKFDAQLKIGSLKGTLVELRDRNLAGK